MKTNSINTELQARYRRLQGVVGGYTKVLVAYSGGVDSVLLLKTAIDCLGSENVLACIGVSDSLAESEFENACRIAEEIGARVEVVRPDEMSNPNYLANPTNRCYFCKSELYTLLTGVSQERACDVVFSGTNADDLQDFRPGLQAAEEQKIVSPLAQAHLTKADIRTLSKHLGLNTWDKPAQPCLSSRVAYGLSITPERLKQVEQGEAFLRSQGLRELRVRLHDTLAPIELPAEHIAALMQPGLRDEIVRRFKEMGFVYVTLDLQGFRSGSGNELLNISKPSPADAGP